MMYEEVGHRLRECKAELNRSIKLIRHYARLAPELLAHKTIVTQASLSQIRFEPLGTVLAVIPWNYPVWQVLRFAVPALCAGSACAVKSAPSVSRITAALFNATDNGLPAIPARLDELDTLKAIERTDVMAFIGSTLTGHLLAAHAGAHLKRSVLELGGSNAFVVIPNADLAQMTKEACYLRFRNVGRPCNAAKRIIVTQATAKKFIPPFLVECVKLKTGSPLDTDTTPAPLYRVDLCLRVHEQVEDASGSDAEYLLGSIIPDGNGWFYPATTLDHVNPNYRVYREEVLDPVAMSLRAKDAIHAVELANDSPLGLGACIYTADTAKVWRFAEKAHAGSVLISRHTSSDLRLPFGGMKNSGCGRELSRFDLYEFVGVKTYWQEQPKGRPKAKKLLEDYPDS